MYWLSRKPQQGEEEEEEKEERIYILSLIVIPAREILNQVQSAMLIVQGGY